MQYPTTSSRDHGGRLTAVPGYPRTALISGALAAVIGAFMLGAWLCGAAARWSAQGVLTMKTNMALGLLLGGGALIAFTRWPQNRHCRRATRAGAILVLLLGGLTLSQHVSGWSLGIDQLLATEAPGAVATTHPNRMGPPGSISHVLLGSALLLLGTGRRRIVPYLGLAILLINLVPAVGFLYAIEAFFSTIRITHIAWPTVVAFMALGLGLVVSCPDSGPMSLLMRDDAGGTLLRRVLPVASLVPLGLGFVKLQAEHAAWLDPEARTGLLVLAIILVISLILGFIARRVSAADRQQQLIQAERQKFASLVDHSTEFIGMCDMAFRPFYVNPAGMKLVGLESLEQACSVHVQEFFFPEDQAMILGEFFPRVLRDGRAEVEVRFRHFQTGAPLWMIYNVFQIRDEAGRPVGYATVSRDITARRQAEESLRAAKLAADEACAVAESANKAKDQFIAVLSHELRTPLAPATVALSILREDPRLPEDARQDLHTVAANLELEVRLIEDLLDISRATSGKMHLHARPVCAAQVVRDAAAVVAGEFLDRGQTLSLDMAGAPWLLRADPARLQQIFWNLLRNASKFSPPGARIAVRGRLVSVDVCPLVGPTCPIERTGCPFPPDACGRPAPRNLVIEVIDPGCGIAPEVLPRLFEPFAQDDGARIFGGLGLGLAICKTVVELHGGTIDARSDGPGAGATFTVRLPAAQCPLDTQPRGANPPETQPHEAQPADAPRLRIVLVEDHPDTARMMQRLLARQGHNVTLAHCVAEGLTAVCETAPDLLISDVGLPDGTGLDLMRQLMERGRTIPAIALSGYGQEEDLRNSLAAGFAEHLVKPISDAGVLAAAIARLNLSPCRKNPAPRSGTSPESAGG